MVSGMKVPDVSFGPVCFPFFCYFSFFYVQTLLTYLMEKFALILMESLDLGLLMKKSP